MDGNIWENAITVLKYDKNIEPFIIDNILAHMEEVHRDENVMVLSCRDEFSLEIVKNNEISSSIRKAVSLAAGRDLTVNFIVKGDENALRSSVIPFSKSKDAEKKDTPYCQGISSDFTFDNFIVGDCNRFAHASAVYVANHPGSAQRNPLYLWGNSGLGKTHLMKAIGYSVSQKFKNKTVLYNTCEEFTNSYIYCTKNNKWDEFRNKYRNVDVLLIDDIQFLINKEGTQIEFFNTFDALISQGKQIVITSDKAPKNLTELDERFTSRFQNGMIMDIQPPDFETRKAILMSKIEHDGLDIDDDIINYVCENVTRNVRELNGAYNIISSYYVLSNGELTLESIESHLAAIISPGSNRTITPEMVVDTVARYYSVPSEKLISSNRSADIFKPRAVAMSICRDLLDMQYEKIGSFFGGKKHTTVINATRKVEEDPVLLQDVENIKKRLNED